MASPVWYRSLYWRIALGFVLLLSGLLGAQGLVFMWLTGRPAGLLPVRSPAEFAQSIASGLSTELSANPDTDLDAYLNDHFRSRFQSFVVVTNDGRSFQSRSVPPPPSAERMASGHLFGDSGGDGASRGRGNGPADRGFGGGRGGGRGDGRGDHRPPGRGPDDHRDGGNVPLEYAAVVVNGASFAMVAVPREPPPVWFVLANVGPTLAGVAFALLVLGTSMAALLVFRPTHRRLRVLQQAAEAIGAGRIGIRAPTEGGDEVSSLAVSFNDMAAGLEGRADALAAADTNRRQLLADISHELSTPLAAIRGYVETLGMQDLQLDEQTRRRYLGIVEDESQRLEHIIGDLLDLARLEGGGGSVRREPVSLPALIERLEHRHAPALAEKGVTLTCTIAPNVPLVPGDATRLEQALQNLVANAIRHTPPGKMIRVSVDLVGADVRIDVEDEGPGIPVEHLPRIFDRFYKVDESRSGTALPSGSGLGLSIVQAIVQRHGGRVSASNAAHGGARFEVRLPQV